ncbi:EF-hand domain-containing protein [Rhizobium tubonense]|uniref:EF-hand domain-containing protein n=1 Tax=Rhizobium tubonense TaxID=484088 RepID=UPI001FCED0A5|nr:EF-hand domain-containing protein [Rhizobium tubonense]
MIKTGSQSGQPMQPLPLTYSNGSANMSRVKCKNPSPLQRLYQEAPLTSISSVLSSGQYKYKSTTSVASIDDSDLLLSSGTSTKTSSSSSSSSSDTSTTDEQSIIAAAEKLFSQMMAMMLNNQSGSSDSSGDSNQSPSDQPTSQADMISAIDTNGDGSISKQEFVAARPSNVSEDQASSLFSSFDSDNTGSLTEAQLAEAMQSHNPPPPPGAKPSDDDLSKTFSSMDKDGDGGVSEAEFIAARPSDVSEDQATILFKSLDTAGAGSLTEAQFATAMKSQTPPAPPPMQLSDFASLYSSNYDDSTSKELINL